MLTAWVPIAALHMAYNPPAWSVSCEIFFYSLFPLLLGILRRTSTRRLVLVAGGSWMGQGLVLLALGHVPRSNNRDLFISRFPILHLGEFTLGVCVVLLYLRYGMTKSLWRRTALIGSLLAMIALMIWRPVTPSFILCP